MSDSNALVAWLRMPTRDAETHDWWRLNLRQEFSEGYPTGNYSIHGIHKDDLQRLADWLITLPPDLYEPAAEFHRAIERAVIEHQKRWGP